MDDSIALTDQARLIADEHGLETVESEKSNRQEAIIRSIEVFGTSEYWEVFI
jgi:hypothetical protein